MEGPEYEKEMEVNWSQTSWLPAACFVRPQNALQVAAILKLVTNLESRFAVRSGGHNANAGFSSVGEMGMLIDLQDIDTLKMEVVPDNILTTGSGNRWISIYEYLDTRYGLAAVGGRHGGVGVAGFLLGGGMSFFPNMYGLGADSVENFECVLANSTFVNANATNHSDLFRALKGGGPNFAIVTEFSIRAHDLRDIWYSLDIFEASDYKAVLNATVQAQLEMETDPRMGMFVNVHPGAILVGRFYAKWISRPKGFAAFDTLKPAATHTPATNGTLLALISALETEEIPARREPRVVSLAVSLDLYVAIHEEYLALLNTSAASSTNFSYTIQPMSVSGIRAGEVRGGNTLGIQPVPQTYDTAAHDLTQSFGTGIEKLAQARNDHYRYQFMNDASYAQSPLRSYGPANWANMQAVSSAYDPAGIFQRLQYAGFLLSRS
ncbi:6-hydroxy-D-nicotine oxidase [Lentithecium fluviatile CBS 122367]|uniref:6-hydroxy-D-nicotine oxidase n=1 Tax=Lentithecium fluviatile CBS 122367 TaxID=1168545 RepID=A0A6G1JE76_9PLEO|nr:6-hydroxy-D-nicotine oxidase [Lentithecium fluviatile CBS 122367]